MPLIFILDDDEVLLPVYDMLLIRHGFTVFTFSRSAPLLEALRTQTPDIILLDVIINEPFNGRSFCTQLKEQHGYPNKILLISAAYQNVKELEACGSDGFIEKPFDIHNFIRAIKAALRS